MKIFKSLAFALPAALAALAKNALALTILGTDLGCDPAKAPLSGGCGVPAFFTLMARIITLAAEIIVPIAVAVILYGGIVIMTAGGSQERVSKGKKLVTTAVVGIAIALGSWLIINGVYYALTGSGV